VIATDVAAGNPIQQGRILALHSVLSGLGFADGMASLGSFKLSVKSGIHHLINIAILSCAASLPQTPRRHLG
jgi:hypothetical protein